MPEGPAVAPLAGALKTELGPATFLDMDDFRRNIEAGIEALRPLIVLVGTTSSVVRAWSAAFVISVFMAVLKNYGKRLLKHNTINKAGIV